MRRWGISSVRLTLLATLLATLTLSTTTANAAGFDLRWTSCAADGGTSNQSFACDTDAGTNTMVASFKLDQPITGFFLFEAVLDFIVAGNQPVPAWWEILDGCHFLGLQADATIDPGAVNCADWGAGQGSAVLSNQNHDGSIAPADTASHRRIFVLGGINPPGPDLVANQEYFLFNLVLDHTTTVDPDACAGCTQPVCIVLNSIRLTGGTFLPTTLGSAQAAGGNFATWQGGSGANCTAVPSRRATWGAVKSLYR